MKDQQQHERRSASPGMESLIGYLLLVGVLLSTVLVVVGLLWNWARTGTPELDYRTTAANLLQFAVTDLREMASGTIDPQHLVNMGIAVLMLTPFVRVLASVFYFAFEEHNRKYTLFTSFVLAVLTYALLIQ